MPAILVRRPHTGQSIGIGRWIEIGLSSGQTVECGRLGSAPASPIAVLALVCHQSSGNKK
jgi:hypothetical protein